MSSGRSTNKGGLTVGETRQTHTAAPISTIDRSQSRTTAQKRSSTDRLAKSQVTDASFAGLQLPQFAAADGFVDAFAEVFAQMAASDASSNELNTSAYHASEAEVERSEPPSSSSDQHEQTTDTQSRKSQGVDETEPTIDLLANQSTEQGAEIDITESVLIVDDSQSQVSDNEVVAQQAYRLTNEEAPQESLDHVSPELEGRVDDESAEVGSRRKQSGDPKAELPAIPKQVVVDTKSIQESKQETSEVSQFTTDNSVETDGEEHEPGNRRSRGRRGRHEKGGIHASQHASISIDDLPPEALNSASHSIEGVSKFAEQLNGSSTMKSEVEQGVAESTLSVTNTNPSAAMSSVTVAVPTVGSSTSSAGLNAPRATAAGSSASQANSEPPAAGSGQNANRSSDTAVANEKAKSGSTSKTDLISRAKLIQRVSKAFQHLGADGGRVRIRLAPAELGTVQLEMRIRQKMVQTRVVAESEAAASALREHLPDLRGRLEAHGLQIESLTIEVESEQTQSQLSSQDQGSSWNDHESRKPNDRQQGERSEEDARVTREQISSDLSRSVVRMSSGVDVQF